MRRALLLACLLAVLAAPCARGHQQAAELAFRPQPGAQLPLAAELRDERGRDVRLGQYFGARPVVLLLAYLRCRELCAVALRDIVTALEALPLDPGRDFQFLVVSIDPRDQPPDAAAAKAAYLAGYRRPGIAAGVHFLTGGGAAVRRIADAAGFPYRSDGDRREYMHPAGLVFVAPDGRISTYLLGIAVSPAEMAAGLQAAARGERPSPLTRILLACHITGVPFGRFTAPVIATITVTNLIATLVLFIVFAAIRRRRHR